MSDISKTAIANLEVYCDLTELQYEVLKAAKEGFFDGIDGSSLRHLADLIGADLRLTPHGQDVFTRAQKVVAGTLEVSEFTAKELKTLDRISGISLAHRARKATGQFFNSADMKFMLHMAKAPGEAVRHLRRVFGELDSRMERGIITQGEFRGDPIYLTQSSMDLLHKLAGEVEK